LKKYFAEGPFSFHRGIPFGDIRKCSGSTDLGAKRKATTEVAGDGPLGNWVQHGSAIRAGIQARLTTDALFLICDDCVRFRESFPSTRRAGADTGRLLTVLTDDWHKDRYLFPLLHVNPREGRAAGALMGEAANHLTGLASCTPFWNNGNRTHLNCLSICSL
jgi:hypothetical protein